MDMEKLNATYTKSTTIGSMQIMENVLNPDV